MCISRSQNKNKLLENFAIFQFLKENEKILLKYGEQRKKRENQPSIEKHFSAGPSTNVCYIKTDTVANVYPF